MDFIRAQRIDRHDGVVTITEPDGTEHRVPADGRLAVSIDLSEIPESFQRFFGSVIAPAPGETVIHFTVDSTLNVVPLEGSTYVS